MSEGETRFPASWLKKVEQLPRQLTVSVAGYAVTVPLTPDELTRAYLPVLSLLNAALGERRRIVAGLAGIPGSGKSTFAAVLARLADALLGMGRLIAVGMDGWHWPNSILDARTTKDEAGNVVPLRQRKGGPESFDTVAMAAAVANLLAADRPVSLPVYDRRVHDPVPNGLTVGPGTAIVLLEGNFLLEPNPPWDAVSRQLRPKLFLDWDPADARERVIARHVRGGAAPEEAARKYECNDRLNTTTVLATSSQADYILRLSSVPSIRPA
jgi:pantothenate kinase